jgi:hypothetical protein
MRGLQVDDGPDPHLAPLEMHYFPVEENHTSAEDPFRLTYEKAFPGLEWA